MKKSILIIGGTQFVGRHIVQSGLALGHDITLFTRGKTNPNLFAGINHIVGDRRTEIALLGDSHWDVVIDTCGYIVSEVVASTHWLQNRCKHYVFISSVSAYAGFAKPNDENSPLGAIEDSDTSIVDGRTYGPLKAHCEAVVKSAFGPRALIIRPGLIVGPWDHTDRFTYWIARALRGGIILAPESPHCPIQFIDVRDLAKFVWHCVENRYGGAFNVLTTAGRDTLGDLISKACETAKKPARIHWAKPDFLETNTVSAWNDMPLWLGPKDTKDLGDMSAFMASSNAKAINHGLTCASLTNTVDVLMTWFEAQPESRRNSLKSGLSAEREQALLAIA